MCRFLYPLGALIASGFVSLALALALIPVAEPGSAQAETVEEAQARVDASSAKLEDAEAALEEMGKAVMAAGEYLQEIQYSLEQTQEQISATEQEIEQKEIELDENQEVLGKQMVDEYKTGALSLVSVFLNSNTIADFINNMYYYAKVEERSSQIIDEVTQMRAELADEKSQLEGLEAEQQSLVDQQTEQLQVLQDQQAAQQDYVNNLSAEVQAALEAKRQAELEEQRRAAEEARRQAELEAQRQAQAQASQSPGGSSYDSGISAPSVSSSGGGLSSSQRQAILNAAYSQIGVPYSYGAYSPGSAFDCSGFTKWCYAQAGISIPHSASAQGGGMTRVSRANAQPGDLMIWLGGMNPMSGNHAAIYLGGDQMINADWQGVVIESIWSRGPDLWGYYS